MTSSGTGAGVPDRKCKGAPRGMEALPILFHATILACRKGSLGLMIKFLMCNGFNPFCMAIAIRQPLRHLFPRPYAIHIVEPHHPALLLRKRIQPAFRVLARLCERKRFFCGAALIVHQFRDDPRHLVMVVRSGWHSGEDRGQPFRPCAQHLGLFIQPPDLLTQEAQAVQIFKGQVSSPVFRSKHLWSPDSTIGLLPAVPLAPQLSLDAKPSSPPKYPGTIHYHIPI